MPVIIRDLFFYMAGFVFGIEGQTNRDCVEFYKALMAQNKHAINLHEKKTRALKKEIEGNMDIEDMFLKHI